LGVGQGRSGHIAMEHANVALDGPDLVSNPAGASVVTAPKGSMWALVERVVGCEVDFAGAEPGVFVCRTQDAETTSPKAQISTLPLGEAQVSALSLQPLH